MHPNKSRGPDGMNPGFYHSFWDIVRDKVTIACLEILNSTSHLSSDWNTTSIVLIPEKERPQKISDLKPIALCNVMYKILAKVLANRPKQVLPLIFSESQSAFIPGRLLTDSAMIAFEIVRYLKRNRQGKNELAARSQIRHVQAI